MWVKHSKPKGRKILDQNTSYNYSDNDNDDNGGRSGVVGKSNVINIMYVPELCNFTTVNYIHDR